MAFNQASSLLAASDANGHVYLWAKGHVIALTDPSGVAIHSVIFTADDYAVIGGDGAGNTYLWAVTSRKITESRQDPNTKGINSVAFNASTKTIAAADSNGLVYLWLYTISKPVVPQYPNDKPVISVAYSPDDSHLAAASADGYVYVKRIK